MNWLKADWPAPDFIRAGTTTRQGGVSKGAYDSFNLATHVGDDRNAVQQNRAKLAVPNQPQWLEQVHSTIVVKLPNEVQIPKADAVYTEEKNQVCAVMTADCLPLLITDTKGSQVAAIHAGWRGLCDGVIEATIRKLAADPESLLVWLGPAIGPDVYEVGKDVYDAFIIKDSAVKIAFTQVKDKHWLFDIYQAAKIRLQGAGVNQVFGGGHCTLTEQDKFYSFRRDKVTGRMASMIWIEK